MLKNKPNVVYIGFLKITYFGKFYIFFTYLALKKYMKYYIFDPKRLHIFPRPTYMFSFVLSGKKFIISPGRKLFLPLEKLFLPVEKLFLPLETYFSR